MKKLNKIVILLALVVLVFACVKLEVNSLVTIRGSEILFKNSKPISLDKVVAYTFHVDTAEWDVKNYDDALLGVITSRADGSTRNYDQIQELDSKSDFPLDINNSPQMIVVCSQIKTMYAYRGIDIPDNLDNMILDATFQSFLPDTTYFEKGWNYVLDDCLVTIEVQEVIKENEEPTPMTELIAHSFAADIKQWRIKNYAGALNGVIATYTEGSTQYYSQVQEINESKLLFNFKQSPQMVVVCSKDQFAYAYKEVIIPQKEGNKTLIDAMTLNDVTFQTWKTNITESKDGWNYVYDEYSVTIGAQEILTDGVKDTTSLTEAIAYSFAVDTTKWKVKNYADALQGILTFNSNDDSTQLYNQVREINDSEFEFNFKQSPQMVIVCSKTKPMYAYRGVVIAGDEDVITPNVTFQTWKTNTTFEEKGWNYVYEEKTDENVPE